MTNSVRPTEQGETQEEHEGQRAKQRCHIKLKHVSSFKAVTRKQPFLCRSGDPALGAHIIVVKGEEESAEAVKERLNRLDPNMSLCDRCASRLPQ